MVFIFKSFNLFLPLKKVIYDFSRNPNSEVIRSVLSQMRLCCADIYSDFRSRLAPNVDAFLAKHSNRTKDVIPNLNSFLLYMQLEEKAMTRAREDASNFEYFYFEEHLRRFLTV